MKNLLIGLMFIFVSLTSFAQGWHKDEMEVRVYLNNSEQGKNLYDLHLKGDYYPTGLWLI